MFESLRRNASRILWGIGVSLLAGLVLARIGICVLAVMSIASAAVRDLPS